MSPALLLRGRFGLEWGAKVRVLTACRNPDVLRYPTRSALVDGDREVSSIFDCRQCRRIARLRVWVFIWLILNRRVGSLRM